MPILREYPNILNLLQQVADLFAQAKTMELAVLVTGSPEQAAAWSESVLRHGHRALCMVIHLSHHPAWAEELERLLAPADCPANQVAIIEKFFLEKAAEL